MQTIDIDKSGRLAGSRFTVYHIVPMWLAGDAPPAIQEIFPGLSVEQIEAMIRFVEENKQTVLEQHQRIEDRIAQGNPPWVEEVLANSPHRARIRARLAEILEKRTEETNGERHLDRP